MENKDLKLEDTFLGVLLKFDESSKNPNTDAFNQVMETCSEEEKKDVQAFVKIFGYVPSLKELKVVLEKAAKMEKARKTKKKAK